jgi:hypothetical protein
MWTSHDLAGIDLLDDTAYLVDESSTDPDPKQTDEYTGLRASDGARLTFDEEAETVQILNVICVGTTLAIAKANRQAIDDVLTAARASDGQTYTYSFQEDVSEPEPDTWYLIGGRLKAVTQFSGSGRIFGAGNLWVAPAIVSLGLSKT